MAMFGSKKTDSFSDAVAPAINGSSNNGTGENKVTIIADGTVIRGDIETPSNLRIDGKVIGNIISTSNVAIGKGGMVDGNVAAATLRVSGAIKGNIEVSVKLILDASASILGDIKAKDISMESGATLNGRVGMDGGAMQQDFNSLAFNAVSGAVSNGDATR
jgi:cytoskeletal protein CcmA (bactofilin family)